MSEQMTTITHYHSQKKAVVVTTTTTAPGAAAACHRISLDTFDRLLHNLCGNSEGDEWREATISAEACEDEHALMLFCAAVSGARVDVPFLGSVFYAQTLVGPVLALFEQNALMVQLILFKSNASFNHLMRAMIEESQAKLHRIAAA